MTTDDALALLDNKGFAKTPNHCPPHRGGKYDIQSADWCGGEPMMTKNADYYMNMSDWHDMGMKDYEMTRSRSRLDYAHKQTEILHTSLLHQD